jgi:hypothetical protein
MVMENDVHGREEKCIHDLVGKPQRKIMIGRPRHRWENNIKMTLKEMGWEGVNWIDLAQDRDQPRALVNTVRNLWFLLNQMFMF